MFDYNKKVTAWEDTGTEPPEGLRKWQAGEKPPAAWWNWFWDAAQKCFADIKNWIQGHQDANTGVHGVGTGCIETVEGAQAKVNNGISDHELSANPHPVYATDNDLVTHNHDSVYVKLGANSLVPPGVINPFAGTVAPSGWLLCYGQAVSRITYSDLFAVIGAIYGTGDGSSTFNLPDLRGRFPLGADNMGNVSANRVKATEADELGKSAGEETHFLSIAEMPSHNHGIEGQCNRDSDSTGGDYFAKQDSETDQDGVTKYEGGGQAHNNMPPYITINYIIRF